MIHRPELLRQVEYSLKRNPVTAILGPRQCGKTTLAGEIGRREKPTITKSMRIAMQDLKLERLWVVYLGKSGYPMDEKIECVSLSELDRIRETLE